MMNYDRVVPSDKWASILMGFEHMFQAFLQTREFAPPDVGKIADRYADIGKTQFRHGTGPLKERRLPPPPSPVSKPERGIQTKELDPARGEFYLKEAMKRAG